MTTKPSKQESRREDGPVDATPPHSVFLRGLSLGALIGAAIAGSAIWDRRRRRSGATGAESADEAEPKG